MSCTASPTLSLSNTITNPQFRCIAVCPIMVYYNFREEVHAWGSTFVRARARTHARTHARMRARACTRDENFCLYFKGVGVKVRGADTRVHSMPSRPPSTHAQHNTQHTTHKTLHTIHTHTHTHTRTPCQRQTHKMELLCVRVHTHRV